MSKPRRVCAIRDAIPAYRQGLARELASVGYETADPGECDTWIKKFRHATVTTDCRLAVVLSVRGDADLDVVRSLHAIDDQVALLALLVDPTAESYSQALKAGAWGAVDYAAAPIEIVETLEAAFCGAVRLPRSVLVELASQIGKRVKTPVGSCDVDRLAALAKGWSVEQLANHENFSTREMFRRLNELYRSLGVANRHQAIVVAARSGLLDDTIDGLPADH